MLAVSTTILLAALAAAPSFAAPVAFETRDSHGIEARAQRRQSSSVSGSALGSRDTVESIINQRSLEKGTRDLIDQFDMEVRNGEEKKKDKTRGNMFFMKGAPGALANADAISNNLANISSTGFKSSKAMFEELIMQSSVSRSTAPSYTGARWGLIEDEFTLDLAARDSQGIEAHAPHRRQTTCDFDQFGIDIHGDQEDLKKKYLEHIKNDKGIDKQHAFLKKIDKNEIELKNINKKENIINKYDKKTVNNFNSQSKSKKGKQRRSLGSPSSFAPAHPFDCSTSHWCREDAQDFLENDSMFEAREIDKLD
ncbi:hypothetical protein BKA70DRAFT_1528458 [Coprinopsis sp. MPI-PUGE-AT-0042]|nr:hypothetical protein BKA70DRAFT_1528458 [Coprinopsis sp. MPI-PUGE-AT-0042]